MSNDPPLNANLVMKSCKCMPVTMKKKAVLDGVMCIFIHTEFPEWCVGYESSHNSV